MADAPPLPTYEENGVTITVCPPRYALGADTQPSIRPRTNKKSIMKNR